MNDDHVLVRPLFRVLYGIVAAIGVGSIFLSLVVVYTMWDYKTLGVWGLSTWCIFIGFQFLSIVFAYTGFITAVSGKPPKYLIKYADKYKGKCKLKPWERF